MATLLGTKAIATVSARLGLGLVEVISEYALGAALALNDVLEMVKVPKGARIFDGWLNVPDLDTNGSPAIILSVGDGGSTARYLSASNIGQAGGFARFAVAAGFGYTYTANDTVDILVATGPATGATSGTLTLALRYTTDP